MFIKPFAISKNVHLFNLSSNHSTSHLSIKQLCNQSTNHRVFRRAICLFTDPSNQLYSSNLCTNRPSFQPPNYLIIHPSSKLSIQSVIHPSGINLSVYLTFQPAIHSFIQRAITLSIDSSKQPYSSNLCTHRPTFQSPKHPIIHPFTKLSIQSAIHRTGISLSIYLTTKSPIHSFIRRAIISSTDTSNHPYIGN